MHHRLATKVGEVASTCLSNERNGAHMFVDVSKPWYLPPGAVRLGLLLASIVATGSQHIEPTHSYLIQAADYPLARSAVAQMHGRITHELPIVNAVAADLS